MWFIQTNFTNHIGLSQILVYLEGPYCRYEKSLKCPQTKISCFKCPQFIWMWMKKETKMYSYVAYLSWFWHFFLQYGLFIYSRNVWLDLDLLLFWQNVHIFSHKCPLTRFAGFLMSLSRENKCKNDTFLLAGRGQKWVFKG